MKAKFNRFSPILIYLAVIFLSSCIIWVDICIKQEDLPWLQEGDTVLFHSEAIIDTFIIEKVYTTGYEMQEGIPDYDYDIIRTVYNQLACEDDCKSLLISVSYKAKSINVDSYFQYVDYSWPYQKYKIGDTVVEKIDECSIPNTGIRSSELVKVVYLHKNYGVIAYELVTGEVFEIDENYLKTLMNLY